MKKTFFFFFFQILFLDANNSLANEHSIKRVEIISFLWRPSYVIQTMERHDKVRSVQEQLNIFFRYSNDDNRFLRINDCSVRLKEVLRTCIDSLPRESLKNNRRFSPRVVLIIENNSSKCDTLAFGHYKTMIFNGKIYDFDYLLLSLIASELNQEHNRRILDMIAEVRYNYEYDDGF